MKKDDETTAMQLHTSLPDLGTTFLCVPLSYLPLVDFQGQRLLPTNL